MNPSVDFDSAHALNVTMSAVPSTSVEAATTSVARPTKSAVAVDLRAEEEAARRMNVGKAAMILSNGKAKASDLFGKHVLQSQLSTMARNARIIFDEEALQYLALVAESRLRSMLADALSVQMHRTNSSHARLPPRTSHDKPMWSHEAILDTQAILDMLNKQNKETEQIFRAERMDRLARETELQRTKEKTIRPAEEEPEFLDPGPCTPVRSSASAASTSTPATPTFGGPIERKSLKKSGKKNVSLEVSQKMTNATAMRSVGPRKQYSWLNSPSTGSTLNPKSERKRKADKFSSGESSKPMSEIPGPTDSGNAPLRPLPDSSRPKRFKRPTLTEPARRDVTVSVEQGVDRKISDNRAITMSDILFSLEKYRHGRGTSMGDDVLRKAFILGGVEQVRSEANPP